MILFCNNTEFYNHVIHNFMEQEGFPEENIINNFLEDWVNEVLVKEQFKKCQETVKELYYWTKDDIPRHMRAFHEVILYDFLRNMSYFQENFRGFNNKYFDKTSKDMIDIMAKEDKKEIPEMSLASLRKSYYNVREYEEYIFYDTDFLELEIFYNEKNLGSNYILKRMGVNLDYYYEILPEDIRKRYPTGHITLSGEISSLKDFIKDRIEHGDLYKLLWNGSNPLNIVDIKNVLNNIILFYFQNQKIDIYWEIKENENSLDLIFYKRRDENTKVLISIFKDIKLKKTLVDKMIKREDDYDNAYFIFLVFNNKEKNKVKEFISNYIYMDTLSLLINVDIFDAHKRRAVSKKS